MIIRLIINNLFLRSRQWGEVFEWRLHQVRQISRSAKSTFHSWLIKPNLDCDYTFPIDLTPNIISFGAKSVGKVKLQSKFGLIQKDSENISLLNNYFTRKERWIYVYCQTERNVFLLFRDQTDFRLVQIALEVFRRRGWGVPYSNLNKNTFNS